MSAQVVPAQVRVLLVDDEQLLRHSLALVVDAEPDLAVVAQAGSGSEALRVARATRPDVVLMDIRMPDGDGIQATRAISAAPELAATRVLVLSMLELDADVYDALRAGASGFLLKDATPEDLVAATRRTHAGESLFAPTILTRLVATYIEHGDPVEPPRPATLTARETEVLALVGAGLSNDDIAARLVISVKTVKSHIGSLLAKLAARDRAQLVIAAYDLALVRPASRR